MLRTSRNDHDVAPAADPLFGTEAELRNDWLSGANRASLLQHGDGRTIRARRRWNGKSKKIFDAFDRLWFRTAKSGSFIEAAGIANDIVREDIMPQNQPFEFPQQLRELAERNVEQARTAYGQLMDAMAQATGMWMSARPSNEMTSGFKVVRERAIQFAKQNAEACFAAASELANAKDIQDLLAIQSRSAQTQMQAYALQAQELGRLMVEAAQSVQPRS